MSRILAILICALPLFGQQAYVAVMWPSASGALTAQWVKIGPNISFNSSTKVLDCVVPPASTGIDLKLFRFDVPAAGQSVFALPASETRNPKAVLVFYNLPLAEGPDHDYTVSTDRRTVTFTTRLGPALAGSVVQVWAVF